MTYTDFYNMLNPYLTNFQIALVQDTAFQYYEDAHGYRPMRKKQKQFAYGFIQEFFYGIEIDECIEFLGRYGVPKIKSIEFWQSLDKE
jgi:hypothetical protein